MPRYKAFEIRRLSELQAVGATADMARQLAEGEWRQMDEAARQCWVRKAEEAAPASSGRPSLHSAELPLASQASQASDAAAGNSSGSKAAPTLEREPGVKREPGSQEGELKPAGGASGTLRALRAADACSARSAGVGQAVTPSRAEAKRGQKRSAAAAAAAEGVKAEPAPGPRAGGAPRAASAAPLAPGPGPWVTLSQLPAAAGGGAGERASDGEEEQEPEPGERKQTAFRVSRAVPHGRPHPDWLTEPAAVAEISLPPLPEGEVLRLPPRVVDAGLLSSPQLESVAYAARRYRALLPNGCRAGYYLGDGTGCGKGRVIASLIWHLWNSGARRHVWISASADLKADALRDFSDLGAQLPVCSLSEWGYGPVGTGRGLDSSGDGVMFLSYSLLVAARGAGAEPTPATSRLGQLIAWLRAGRGGACGLVALDEAHRAKNVALEGVERFGNGAGASSGSRAGACSLELQRSCPGVAVLYASATGATEIRHLGYLERLGLWGAGRPHSTFEELRAAVESGGLAAMELVAAPLAPLSRRIVGKCHRPIWKMSLESVG